MSAKHTFAVYDTIVGSAKDKLVLLKLADNSNDEGICWPSMKHLQKHTELSRSSVLRALKSLEEKGLISVTRRKTDDRKMNLSNVYQLTLPSLMMTPPQCQTDTTPSVMVTPKSNNIESNNKSNNINICEIESIKDLYNATITNHKPNWAQIQELNNKRKTLIKNLISFAKKRIKQSEDQNEKPVKYLERLFFALAQDQFHAGKIPSAQHPNGYRWTFDQVAKQDNLIKFIEKESA